MAIVRVLLFALTVFAGAAVELQEEEGTCSTAGSCTTAGVDGVPKLSKDHQLVQLSGGWKPASVAQVVERESGEGGRQRVPGGLDCRGMPDVKKECSANACKVLATNMKGKTCNEYCARDGRTCAGAWEEKRDNCEVKEEWLCHRTYHTATSDLLCECSLQKHVAPLPHGEPRQDPSKLTLVWSDEFEGNSVDTTKWNLVNAGGGFGNWELQFYRPDNARVEDGALKIFAKCQGYRWHGYTSAKLETLGRQAWGPGHRFDIRAKVPKGLGTWSAIWMLPTENAYGGWPKSGEIDIMESVGCTEDYIHGTIHTEAYNHMRHTEKKSSVSTNVEGWHVYSIQWTESQIMWYIDDKLFHSFASDPSSDKWPFNREFYLILNLAVGGGWGGFCLHGRPPSCRDTKEFSQPQVMEVDYVRVYTL